jgi:hypothetical protein
LHNLTGVCGAFPFEWILRLGSLVVPLRGRLFTSCEIRKYPVYFGVFRPLTCLVELRPSYLSSVLGLFSVTITTNTLALLKRKWTGAS